MNKVKVALASALGAIFALIFPLLNLSEFILGALKLLSGFLLITLSTPRINGKKLYLCYTFFLAFTFLLGGTLIGVYEIFNLDYSSEISVALAFLPCYIIIRFITEIIKFLYQKKNVESFCYQTEITYNEKTLTVKGFLDSGNGAYYKGIPIVFLNKEKAEKFFSGIEFLKDLIKVKIQTLNGESDKLCFIASEIKIYFLDKVSIFNNVAVCISRGLGDYDVILHSSMIKGGENESDKFTIKAS